MIDIEHNGILISVRQLEIENFIKGMDREALERLVIKLGQEIDRLQIAAGETAPPDAI